jgi:hypothetical protein
VIKSFNLFPYYSFSDYGEVYAYNARILAGSTVVSGPTHISFKSDAAPDHNVSFNYTGLPGQTLKLEITRVACTQAELGATGVEGSEGDIAADDITFAQTPATTFAAGPQVISVTPADDTSGLPANSSPPYAATIADGPTLTAAAPFQLKLDGALVSPPPTVTPLGGGQTSVTYPGASSLLPSGSHVYTLTYADNLGGVYTNEVVFSATYTTLPPTYALPPG